MKKLYKFLLLIFLILTLGSCKKEFMFSSEMIINNINIPNSSVQTNSITTTSLSDYTIELAMVNLGVLIVKDSSGKTGCWSLYINDLLFDLESDISIQTKIATGMYYVQKKYNLDNTSILYDVYGGVVLPKREYTNIEAKIIYDYEQLGEVIGTNNVEKLVYTYIENGSTFTKTQYNQLNPETRTREEIKDESNKYEGALDRIELYKYGLATFYMTQLDNTYYIYKADGKLVNRVYLSNTGYLGIVNGKFLYQNKYIVDENRTDYTYLDGGNKYIIESFSVDMISGNVRKLNLDYEFTSIAPYNNSTGLPNLGYASIYRIEGKNKLPNRSNVIIDNEGLILYDSGTIYLNNLIMINSERFYDLSTKYIFNQKMEPVFALDNMEQIVPEEGWIVTKQDSYYGIIDGDGNGIIPFEYSRIFAGFANKKTVGLHKDGKMYIISPESKSVIEGKSYFITKGLVFSETYDSEKDEYTGKFIDYNNTVVKQINYPIMSAPTFSTSGNIYGNYYFSRFKTAENEFIYISIDTGKN